MAQLYRQIRTVGAIVGVLAIGTGGLTSYLVARTRLDAKEDAARHAVDIGRLRDQLLRDSIAAFRKADALTTTLDQLQEQVARTDTTARETRDRLSQFICDQGAVRHWCR